MCLALPAEIIEIHGDTGKVNLGGVLKDVSLSLLDDAVVGDFVLIHVGYALNRISPEEAERTLQLFAEAGREGAT
jgi:hydrogenase expression/formation protein HypC